MKKINWIVRAKNKTFWLALVPAIFVAITQITNCFGFNLDFSTAENQIITIIEAIFSLFAIFGIIIDPTTKGITDSDKALSYIAPSEQGDTTYKGEVE